MPGALTFMPHARATCASLRTRTDGDCALPTETLSRSAVADNVCEAAAVEVVLAVDEGMTIWLQEPAANTVSAVIMPSKVSAPSAALLFFFSSFFRGRGPL